MKITFLLVAAFAAFLAIACVGNPTAPTAPQIAQAIADYTADGVITDVELGALKEMLTKAIDSGSAMPTWAATLGTIGGAVLASLLGVRYIPSTAFSGPFDKKPV